MRFLLLVHKDHDFGTNINCPVIEPRVWPAGVPIPDGWEEAEITTQANLDLDEYLELLGAWIKSDDLRMS